MNVVMRSPLYRITEIKYKTRAKHLEDMEVGDLIAFTTDLSHSGSTTRGGPMATVVTLANFTKKTVVHKSQSEMSNIIYKLFELSEIVSKEQITDEDKA